MIKKGADEEHKCKLRSLLVHLFPQGRKSFFFWKIVTGGESALNIIWSNSVCKGSSIG